MNWQSGLIFRINDYRFDDGSQRDKYSIVLKADGENLFVIHCLTTSQNNKNLNPRGHGCNVDYNIPFYFLEPGRVIGNEGFYFDKPTFIFFSGNIRKEEILKLEALVKGPFDLVELGILNKEELKRLIKCALKSRYIPLALYKELSEYKNSIDP